MIIHNAGRKFFALKSDAEKHRVSLGLKPGETNTLNVRNREDLANLLNGLCALEGTSAGNSMARERFSGGDLPIVASDADVPAFIKASFAKYPIPTPEPE